MTAPASFTKAQRRRAEREGPAGQAGAAARLTKVLAAAAALERTARRYQNDSRVVVKGAAWEAFLAAAK